MKLFVNGKETVLAEEAPTVARLVELLGLPPGAPAAVEVNGGVVPRERHGDTALAEGDAVEIVRLVGGG